MRTEWKEQFIYHSLICLYLYSTVSLNILGKYRPEMDQNQTNEQQQQNSTHREVKSKTEKKEKKIEWVSEWKSKAKSDGVERIYIYDYIV